MAEKKFCYCLCHAEGLMGDAHEMRHWGRTASAYALEQESFNHPRGVSVHDYVAAVFACEGCRGWHAAVLKPQSDADVQWVDPPKPATGFEGDDGG